MILFIDTETTGLPRKKNPLSNPYEYWPRLVELAWIECENDGNVIAEYNSIIRPDSFTIPNTASVIHGITTKEAQDTGQSLVLVLEQFHASLKNCSLIVGHNIEFDAHVIATEALRVGMALPIQSFQKKCTMKSSVRLCKLKRSAGYKNPTLAELHYFLFGVSLPDCHRALSDARTCMRCFFELKKRGIL
jgi:DNA polymerase III epsilon subunit-like protein